MGLKRFIKAKNDAVVGLDIGSSTIKAVQLRVEKSGWTAVSASIADIPDATAQKGQDRREETIGAIKNCFESGALKTQYAVCGVTGPEVAVRCFSFPPLPPAEIEGAVMLEAAQVCPFNTEDATIDYQIIPNGESVRGVLVGATNKLINAKKVLVKDASLTCVMIDVEGLAILNLFEAVRGNDTNISRTAILNVGNSHATIAIKDEKGMPFVRDINYAGNDIISKIADETGHPITIVRKVLLDQSCSTAERVDLGDSLGAAVQELIGHVADTLKYFSVQEKAAIVDHVLVCGGFSQVKGFVELLDKGIGAKAILWNPFEKMACAGEASCKEIIDRKGPALAVAAGLALRSM